MERIRVGAFELTRPLGVGGMGEVWAGQHTESLLPVAVKLVSGLTEDLRTTFRREVEAVAALGHPGIVMVYDHGELSAEAAQASEGRFQEGVPWMVMEHASGGTLEDRHPPGSWAELLRLLLGVLDALAHAHARGVVHRDLKPANVLVCQPPDLRPGLKLADFGLALAMDGREVLAVGAGTPAFMAPEQVLKHWWDMGPWTDLYALGGMAWTFATGRRPFPGDEPRKVGRAHVSKPLPAFEPRFPVPAELEGWLRALLAKQPERRPDSAAWCAAELLAMGPADRDATGDLPALPTTGLFTLVPVTGLETVEDVPTLHAVDLGAAQPLPQARTVIRGRLPPPVEWRSAVSLRPYGLTRAGLGLFGVRPAPFEGRREERTALWELLRTVAAEQAPRAAVIRGPGGLGSSRLAEWIGRRAAEVGSAKLIVVPHAGGAGALRGVAALAEKVVRLRGVPEPFATARAEALGIEPEVLLAMARGEATEVPSDLGLRLVLREAEAGTVVLLLDDAHLDESALSLARAVLEAGALRDLPVLILLPVDDGAVAERPEIARLLDRLESHADVEAIELGPLDDPSVVRLIRRMLPLEPSVEARVVEVAQGSPLVVTQLVGSWVQSGAIVSSERGFAPVAGVVEVSDLQGMWERRLAPVVDEWSDPERHAVLAAAVLGPSVDREEWRAVCTSLRLPTDERPLEELVRAGLGRWTEHGFRFGHGLVHLALRHRTEAEGLRPAFESACALVAGDDPERVGRHLHAAGCPLEAFPHLLAATTRRVKQDSHGAAHLLHELAKSCLDEGEVADADPRRGELQQQLVSILMSDWQLEDAAWQARRLELLARRHGWTKELHYAITVQGTTAFRLRRLDDAADHFRRLVAMDDADRARLARALRGLGQVHQARGEYTEADRLYREYEAIAIALDDPFLIASAHNDVGNSALRLGNPDEALRRFRLGVAMCEAHGFKDATIGRMNVIGQLLAREQFVEAHELALVTLEEAEEQVSALALAGAHAVTLRSSAETADWHTFDRVAARLRTVIAAARLWEQSIAEVCADAGRACARWGYYDRARFCLEAARDQYAGMGWDDHVRRIVGELADLDPSMGI